jgi:DNA-binding NtrC family response regulator
MTTRGKRNPHIAVLDAEPDILGFIHRILADRFSVSLFTKAAELTRNLRESSEPDLLLMDWQVSDEDGEENALRLLGEIHASNPSLPIVILACSAELTEVVAAIRMGATDVILKPFKKSDIDLAVEQCLKGLEKPVVVEDDTQEIYLNENISFVRASKRMQEIESHCTLVARADIPVLILGESGTGKEVAAMLIHKLSARRECSFLKVNCAAMPADLLESELFGYEQGAFTGAIKAKPGKFEICNNGTILLDEIGEMPTVLQAKLLTPGQPHQRQSQCSRTGRHQHRHQVGHCAKGISRGPLLPAEWLYPQDASASRAHRGDSDSLQALHAQDGGELRLRTAADFQRPHAGPDEPLLAGQSSRIGEYDQALHRPGRRAGYHRRIESSENRGIESAWRRRCG